MTSGQPEGCFRNFVERNVLRKAIKTYFIRPFNHSEITSQDVCRMSTMNSARTRNQEVPKDPLKIPQITPRFFLFLGIHIGLPPSTFPFPKVASASFEVATL